MVKDLLLMVHPSAVESELFEELSIKTRAIAYENCLTAGHEQPFIHITFRILFGRNHQQKMTLSQLTLEKLKALTTESMSVSVEIVDIDKTTYYKATVIKSSICASILAVCI